MDGDKSIRSIFFLTKQHLSETVGGGGQPSERWFPLCGWRCGGATTSCQGREVIPPIPCFVKGRIKTTHFDHPMLFFLIIEGSKRRHLIRQLF